MKLPKIDISIDGVKYDHSFSTDIAIDSTNLDDEFCTQAEKYAFYAFLAAQAKSSYERHKFELEQTYATIDHEKRAEGDAIRAQNPKFKHTEKMVENEVITDQRYTDKKIETLNAKLLSEQLDKAAASIAQRKDMLVQLGLGHRTTNAPSRAMESQAQSAHEIIRKNKEDKAEAAAAEPAAPTTSGAKPRQRRKPRSAS